jgi:hypothetical protein
MNVMAGRLHEKHVPVGKQLSPSRYLSSRGTSRKRAVILFSSDRMSKLMLPVRNGRVYCTPKAPAALSEREHAGAVLFKEWGTYRGVPLEYSQGDGWERLLRQR